MPSSETPCGPRARSRPPRGVDNETHAAPSAAASVESRPKRRRAAAMLLGLRELFCPSLSDAAHPGHTPDKGSAPSRLHLSGAQRSLSDQCEIPSQFRQEPKIPRPARTRSTLTFIRTDVAHRLRADIPVCDESRPEHACTVTRYPAHPAHPPTRPAPARSSRRAPGRGRRDTSGTSTVLRALACPLSLFVTRHLAVPPPRPRTTRARCRVPLPDTPYRPPVASRTRPRSSPDHQTLLPCPLRPRSGTACRSSFGRTGQPRPRHSDLPGAAPTTARCLHS